MPAKAESCRKTWLIGHRPMLETVLNGPPRSSGFIEHGVVFLKPGALSPQLR